MTSRVETWLGLMTIAVLPALVFSHGALSTGCKVREYKGCYIDVNSDRDLPVFKGSNKQDDECATLCEGFKYFSLQYDRECRCGNSFGKHGPASDCSCSAASIGADRNCVYELQAAKAYLSTQGFCQAYFASGRDLLSDCPSGGWYVNYKPAPGEITDSECAAACDANHECAAYDLPTATANFGEAGKCCLFASYWYTGNGNGYGVCKIKASSHRVDEKGYYCNHASEYSCLFDYDDDGVCHWVAIRNTFFEVKAPLVGIFVCLCLLFTLGFSMTEYCMQEYEKQMFDKAADLHTGGITPTGKRAIIKDVVLQIVFLIIAFVGVQNAREAGAETSAEAVQIICGSTIFALEVPCLGKLLDVTTYLLLINGRSIPMCLFVAQSTMVRLWFPYTIFVLVEIVLSPHVHPFRDLLWAWWCLVLQLIVILCLGICDCGFMEVDQQSTAQQPQQQPLLLAAQTVPQLPQPVDRRGTRWPPFDLSRIPAPPSFWTNQDLSRNFDVRCEVSAKTRAKVETLVNSTWSTTRTRDRKGKMVSKLMVLKVQRIEDALMYVNYQAAKMQMKKRHGQCKKIKDISPGGRVKTAGFSGSSRFGDDHLSPELNECYLFHGTSPGGAAGISEDGFRLSLAGSHRGSMFGDGAYLAECSSKADEYASDDVGSIYQDVYALLLCRALCGEMLYSEEPGNFTQRVLESSGKFDSLLGDREKAVGTYREFVFFNKWQIYPEFVVLYERCYD